MMIAARNAFLMSGAKLPYDAEIEYLESTSTQYVDTGVRVSDKTEFSFWFSAEGYSSTFFPLFGVYESNGYLGVQRTSGGAPYALTWWRGGSSKITFASSNQDYMGVVELSGETLSFRGKTDTIQSSQFQSTGTAWYGRVNGISAFGLTRRIGMLWIRENGVLVRDLIPVRVGQTGYMYDRVSRTLFGNKGTGSFFIGPDK